MSEPGLMAIIDDLMERVQECIEYCRERNLENGTENDSAFLASRMLSHEELGHLDDAVSAFCQSVKGRPPEKHEWTNHTMQLFDYLETKGHYPRTSMEGWANCLVQLRRTRTFMRVLLAEQAHAVDLVAAKTPDNVNKETIMGDVYKNIQNSQITNRSVAESTMNVLNSRSDETLADFIGALTEEVESSGNVEAGELLDQFNEELSRDEPRKTLLKRSWEGLVEILPSVAKVAGAGAAIAKLFS